MSNVNISIAMATYNGEKYLIEQLASIANQKYIPFELVVCDDRSSDRTLEILNNFAKESSFPVRICQNEKNLGYSENFIKCAFLCKGDWIAFCDQDDIWLPEKLMKIQNVINQHRKINLLLIAHSAKMVDEQLCSLGKRSPDYKKNKLYRPNQLFAHFRVRGCAMIFNNKLLEYADRETISEYFRGCTSLKPDHDHWVTMLANTLGHTFFISETLSLYRRHIATVTQVSAMKGSFVNQIRKTLTVGYAEYTRLKMLAEKYSEVLVELAISNSKEKEELLVGSKKYFHSAYVYKNRAILYKNNKSIYNKCIHFILILFSGGYFGKSFYSMGLYAFFKDFLFCFIRKKNIS